MSSARVDELELAGVQAEVDRDPQLGDGEVERVEPGGVGHQRVGAGVDAVNVVARATVERVVAAIGDDRVVAGAADQAVGPRAAYDQVVARAADQCLVAPVTIESSTGLVAVLASTSTFEPRT